MNFGVSALAIRWWSDCTIQSLAFFLTSAEMMNPKSLEWAAETLPKFHLASTK